jgi:hypothetical protein
LQGRKSSSSGVEYYLHYVNQPATSPSSVTHYHQPTINHHGNQPATSPSSPPTITINHLIKLPHQLTVNQSTNRQPINHISTNQQVYDPYRSGSDFVRGFPYSMRSGVATAVSHGLWMHNYDYDAPTQLLKHEEKNERYVGHTLLIESNRR